MISFKSTIHIDRALKSPLYVQICNQLILLIKRGHLAAGDELPSSRQLAQVLGLNRLTIIKAYEELNRQGWICIQASKGTYVNKELPLFKQISIHDRWIDQSQTAGFRFITHDQLHRMDTKSYSNQLIVDDGAPDVRFSPISDLLSIYRRIASREHQRSHLRYGSFYGHPDLRQVLSKYLRETRGINVVPEQILITRGSQMGIYLASQLIPTRGPIVVGNTNYLSASETFIRSGHGLHAIDTDTDGIDTAQLEVLCKSTQISGLYLTSHHHHPTTVSLSAKRRLQALELASLHSFPIIEDDYAYDFHYDNAAILPLASYDPTAQVIYVGSFCKLIAPGFRIGFMLGPRDLIREAGQLRRLIDRMGDPLMEKTLAIYISEGGLERHVRKVKKIYRQRRDHFCQLLNAKLSDYLDFNIPRGGMAVWVRLKSPLSWSHILPVAKKKGLQLPFPDNYDYFNLGHNSIRMGFASLDLPQCEAVVDILQKSIKSIEKS